jgi:hypothetical protein
MKGCQACQDPKDSRIFRADIHSYSQARKKFHTESRYQSEVEGTQTLF